jgi:hypothetical protein
MVRLLDGSNVVRSAQAIVLISLFSVACLAESPELTHIAPTDSPVSVQIAEVEITPTPSPWLCLKGQIQLSDEAGGQWIIGEKLLCAPEWKISNLYGPNLDDLEDPIYFNDFIPQE